MDRENINEYLSIKIPELKSSIDEIIRYWMPEKVPSHVLYGDTLNDFLFKLLKENSQKNLIKKIFDFYEEMAESNDEYVRNLLQVTLLEYLWDDYKILGRAHKFMHPKTRMLSDELQIYFKPFNSEKY